MGEGGHAIVDFGRFCTGFLVVMGVALPVLLAHCALIQVPAMAMSIIGGRSYSSLSREERLMKSRSIDIFNDY